MCTLSQQIKRDFPVEVPSTDFKEGTLENQRGQHCHIFTYGGNFSGLGRRVSV